MTGVLGLLLHLPAQGKKPGVRTGTYSDGIVTLQLQSDSVFLLHQPDAVFPSHQKYKTTGKWTLRGDTVVLNPEKRPWPSTLTGIGSGAGMSDSLTVEIRYRIERYRNEVLQETAPYYFDRMTVYANTAKHAQNLVRAPIIHFCLLAPPVRRQRLVDSSNTFRVAKRNLSRLGFYTYGWSRPVEMPAATT